jgi:SAM-dependent methyltransferase
MPTEQRRLQLMQILLDPNSKRILTERGLAAHWRCLELGAGDGSIARWLGEKCPDGRVVATDLDLSYLDGTTKPPVEVLRHDVVQDDFPDGSFDLIHARMLLVNLPERDTIVPRLVRWLAPGGWLVIEDPDTTPGELSAYPAMQKGMRALAEMAAKSHGAAPRWSRALPMAFADAGLTELGLSITSHHAGNGADGGEFWQFFMVQIGPAMIANGLLTEGELQAAVELFDDPQFVDVVCSQVVAWGRKVIA